MIKNSQRLTHYHKNRDAILQKSREYYENNKEKRKEYQKDGFHNMTNEKRDKVSEYWRVLYSKLDEEKKIKIRKNGRDKYYAIKVC